MTAPSRAQRRLLARQNAKQPVALQLIPRHEWPQNHQANTDRLRAWRSRDFLVQEYREQSTALVRLSVNRTSMTGDRWTDNISWDELQDIKAQCGYALHDAVEVYPPAGNVVNVANIRHLWVLRERLPFAWRASRHAPAPSTVAAPPAVDDDDDYSDPNCAFPSCQFSGCTDHCKRTNPGAQQ